MTELSQEEELNEEVIESLFEIMTEYPRGTTSGNLCKEYQLRFARNLPDHWLDTVSNAAEFEVQRHGKLTLVFPSDRQVSFARGAPQTMVLDESTSSQASPVTEHNHNQTTTPVCNTPSINTTDLYNNNHTQHSSNTNTNNNYSHTDRDCANTTSTLHELLDSRMAYAHMPPRTIATHLKYNMLSIDCACVMYVVRVFGVDCVFVQTEQSRIAHQQLQQDLFDNYGDGTVNGTDITDRVVTVSNIQESGLYAARLPSGQWCRAVVLRAPQKGEELRGEPQVMCFCPDDGWMGQLNIQGMRRIIPDALDYPVCAYRCKLVDEQFKGNVSGINAKLMAQNTRTNSYDVVRAHVCMVVGRDGVDESTNSASYRLRIVSSDPAVVEQKRLEQRQMQTPTGTDREMAPVACSTPPPTSASEPNRSFVPAAPNTPTLNEGAAYRPALRGPSQGNIRAPVPARIQPFVLSPSTSPRAQHVPKQVPTLAVPCLQQQTQQSTTNTYDHNWNTHKPIGTAVGAPYHKRTSPPAPAVTPITKSRALVPKQLPAVGQSLLAFVTSAPDPDSFVIRAQDDQVLHSYLQDTMSSQAQPLMPNERPMVGQFYCALLPATAHKPEAHWERLYISNAVSTATNLYRVFLVDVGEFDVLPASSIKRLPADTFVARQMQAIKCKLYGVAPKEENGAELPDQLNKMRMAEGHSPTQKVRFEPSRFWSSSAEQGFANQVLAVDSVWRVSIREHLRDWVQEGAPGLPMCSVTMVHEKSALALADWMLDNALAVPE